MDSIKLEHSLNQLIDPLESCSIEFILHPIEGIPENIAKLLKAYPEIYSLSFIIFNCMFKVSTLEEGVVSQEKDKKVLFKGFFNTKG